MYCVYIENGNFFYLKINKLQVLNRYILIATFFLYLHTYYTYSYIIRITNIIRIIIVYNVYTRIAYTIVPFC